jgi:hypothetical protein
MQRPAASWGDACSAGGLAAQSFINAKKSAAGAARKPGGRPDENIRSCTHISKMASKEANPVLAFAEPRGDA